MSEQPDDVSARTASSLNEREGLQPDDVSARAASSLNEREGAEAGEPEAHDSTGLGLAEMIARSTRGTAPQTRRPKRRRDPEAGVQYSTARSDARDPQPLGAAFERLSAQQGWDTELSVRAIFARWRDLVGPTNAEHSRPESYADGVVTVRCDSTAWATQLRLLAPQLVARLNSELGDGTVRRLQIKGPDGPTWKHGIRSVSDGRGPRDTYG